MSFRRPTAFKRKKWEEPEVSCGELISTSRVGFLKKAWGACGPALERFDAEIIPDIEDVLRNIDIGYADIFVRLYMIGTRQETSRPIIMVCCSNPEARALAEGAIRGSTLSAKFPEYGLGASALPLEQHEPARNLIGEKDPAPDVAMTEAGQDMRMVGRRLYFKHELADTQPFWYATGGAVVRIGDANYQITAGHFEDYNRDAAGVSETSLTVDLDDCHFDGMSDDEDTSEEPIETELDAALARASLTPAAESYRSGFESPGSETSTDSGAEDVTIRSFSPTPVPETSWKLEPLPTRTITRIDVEYLHEVLDFALIGLADDQEVSCLANTIYVGDDTELRLLHPRRCTEVGKVSSKVVVIACRDLIYGDLAPGALYKWSHALRRTQKLYSIKLTTPIEAGDSGSAVIDHSSGQLYGHIVTGCPGSSLAYIIPAIPVFEHLRQKTDLDVSLVGAIDPSEESLRDIRKELEGRREAFERQKHYARLAYKIRRYPTDWRESLEKDHKPTWSSLFEEDAGDCASGSSSSNITPDAHAVVGSPRSAKASPRPESRDETANNLARHALIPMALLTENMEDLFATPKPLPLFPQSPIPEHDRRGKETTKQTP